MTRAEVVHHDDVLVRQGWDELRDAVDAVGSPGQKAASGLASLHLDRFTLLPGRG
jgi:hypothetical protein